MEELSYYRKNKDKWKKGGKYYHYTPKDEKPTIKFQIKRGRFLLSFD
tara:strand:- start:758 stop:898 length:141 start_codon:yes stop_codon:yes gene_type:complete